MLSTSARALAKDDTSTIDSFRLPSQTSINEWEFKYDFIPKVAEPKIPPVSPEAVKQDIAQTKKQQVEAELFTQELNSSIKVEANDASVVHGGEAVVLEPEFLHDRGLEPVDISKAQGTSQSKKTANHESYVQTSVNPGINKNVVSNLGHDRPVDHKTADVEHPLVVDDVEHDAEVKPKTESESSSSFGTVLAVLGLGGVAGYFWFSKEKTPKKSTA